VEEAACPKAEAEQEAILGKPWYFRCEKYRMTLKRSRCAAWQHEGREECRGCEQGAEVLKELRGKKQEGPGPQRARPGRTQVCDVCGEEKELQLFQVGKPWPTCKACHGLRIKRASVRSDCGPAGMKEAAVEQRLVLDLSDYPGLMAALERAAYDEVSSPAQWALRCVKAKLEVRKYFRREESRDTRGGEASCPGGES